MKNKILRLFITLTLIFTTAILPVCATDNMVSTYANVSPRFNNISTAYLSLGFDENNVVYCSISVIPYSNCTGISGIMKLFDSNGTCLNVWSVSDYERPIGAEFTHQGTYKGVYTISFEGYAYSNDGTAPDRLEMSLTDTCE